MTPVRGADWLVGDTDAPAFTPEQFTEEHRLIASASAAFMMNEAAPTLDRLEQKDWNTARRLLQAGGAAGWLGADVPECYGGTALDTVASFIIGEAVGSVPAFGTAFGAQVGLTIAPILWFGTEAQKDSYLPRLVTGEIVGAYALSEAGSGSDALSARARATRRPDGSFVLNGEKLWITNGGFADLFLVFAKVDGEHFTAFLVERGFGGVSNGREEHKMGLHGSSTTSLLLRDAPVPAASVLGEIGQGHKVAFNVLNYGRLKLAAMCGGGARAALAEASRFAAGRAQFGRPIVRFGAIRHKLAEMAIRQFAVESMLYRVAGRLDSALDGNQTSGATIGALEELAIEASILKVAASEMLDYVVDENVQIHGGSGSVRDYPAERRYRDARVNRIFEGTNEINRLLILTMLARRVDTGRLPLVWKAGSSQALQLGNLPAEDTRFALERRRVRGIRQVAALVVTTAITTFRETLAEEQEVLSCAANIVIELFAAESGLLRACASDENATSPILGAAARVCVHDAAARASTAGRTALAATVDGPPLKSLLATVDLALDAPQLNTVALRRQIADAIVDRAGYPF